MEYIKNIQKDEVNTGFLVTTDRKKIWQIEIEMLLELERVCNKYNLKYFADSGTLLGAARHKGFIPWDDDIDVVMFRPDYNKLCKIAPYEFKHPYYLQNLYTDKLPLTISKLRRVDTSAIDNIDDDSYIQGIFLDIWPLDDKTDNTSRNDRIYEIKNLLFMTIVDEVNVHSMLTESKSLVLPNDVLYEILNMSLQDRFREYELFCENHFGESELVCCDFSQAIGKKGNIYRAWYDEVIKLPFEKIEIPAPKKYDLVLQAEYGNWREPVKLGGCHGQPIFSADIPYIELIKQLKA